MPINGLFTPYDYDRIHQAIAYIEKYYQNAISADHLSIEVGMDIKQLQAGIHHLKGLTIHNYILQVRVKRSIKDLEDFAKPIKCIALKNGFSSQSHFGAEFKKQTGLTPKEYRYQLILNGDCFDTIRLTEKAYP